VVVAAIVVTIVGVVYAGPSVLRARSDGRTLVVQGRDAILRDDLPAARARFARATALFGVAEKRLGSPLLWPARAVPVVSTNLDVARGIASVGRQIASAGDSLAASLQKLPGGAFKIKGGQIPLASIASAGDALDAGAAVASAVSDEVAGLPTGWVVPQLAHLRTEVRRLVPGAADAVTKAQAALRGLPSVLGQARYRRYLIAFSNLSELRGSGGLLGYVTALDARSGRIRLEKVSGFPNELFAQPGKSLTYPAWFPDDFRRQAELLQNVNLTTDFPTVGDLLLQATQRKLGPMDGVIAVDPAGVAAMLELTGPIRVVGWRQVITAANVAQVMEHDVYTEIPRRDQRDAFFGLVVRTAFTKLTTQAITIRPRTIGAFDEAVRSGHFRMYSNDGPDESMFEVVGLAGNVDRASGSSDALSVVCENSSGNKADWYLTKNYRYTVRLDPRRGVAQTALDIDVENAAPSGGLPDYVIGSKVPGLPRGTNRLTLMLVRSARDDLKSFAIDGRKVNVLGASEGRLRAYRTGLLVPPGGHARVNVTSVVAQPFFGGSDEPVYRFRVLPQAMAHPDRFDIRFVAAGGWHVVGPAHFAGTLGGDLIYDVPLARTRRGAIIHALTSPFRFAERLVRHVV
jgi:hypothetical protein